MTRLPTLDDAAARDAAFVGAKAAGLAAARALGLPVLPGVVVPVDRAATAAAAGVAALGNGRSGAARLAVMRAPLPAGLDGALRRVTATLGTPLVVRSSSPLEAGGAWSGAFSSFQDVGPQDLATAVRGCWASAFAVDVLARCEATGLGPQDLSLGVLVQPQLRPTLGGLARRRPDGAVEVTATRGPLRALMTGWDAGVRAVVTADGRVIGDGTVDRGTARSVATAADRVFAGRGDDVIEWARVGGELFVLQLRRSEPQEAPRSSRPPQVADAALRDSLALRIAELASRYPGPLAERYVLPWGAAWGGEPAAPPADGPVDLAEVDRLAAGLTARAWRAPPDAARRDARRVLAALRGPSPGDALERLRGLDRVEPGEARRLLSLVAALARRRTDDRRDVRWGPFVQAVVTANGRAHRGVAAAPGGGAGRAVTVADPHSPPRLLGGEVVVAPRPVPALAPLLWRAAGLVTAGGSPGAHLVEVARSLGIPAVVGCDLPDGLDPDALVAVDGDRGLVAVAEPTTTPLPAGARR